MNSANIDDAVDNGDDDEDNDTNNDVWLGRDFNDPYTFVIERVWAKRMINSLVFYLVQLKSHAETIWKPRTNLPWRAVIEFERTYADAV